MNRCERKTRIHWQSGGISWCGASQCESPTSQYVCVALVQVRCDVNKLYCQTDWRADEPGSTRHARIYSPSEAVSNGAHTLIQKSRAQLDV